MQCLKLSLILLMLAGLPLYGWAAEAEAAHAVAAAKSEGGEAGHKEESLSAKPTDLWHIGPFTITNSMVVTWVVALGLIAFAQVATRQIRPVPTGAQNFWE